MEKIKKPRCERCDSTMVYYRIKTNDLVCRLCGHIKNLNKEKKNAKTSD